MKQYTDLIRKALLEGQYTQDRTGGTKSLFGYQMRFDIRMAFHLLQQKDPLKVSNTRTIMVPFRRYKY